MSLLLAVGAGGGTIETRTLSAAGVASTAFVSEAFARSSMSAVGIGAASFVSLALARSTLSAAGAGSTSLVSEAFAESNLLSAGVGTALFLNATELPGGGAVDYILGWRRRRRA